MSVHKSLASKGSLVRSRNVLTRYERILQLRKSGRWTEEKDSPYGLAKVRVLKVKKRAKEKKKKEETAAAQPGAPAAAQAAAPAASAPGSAQGKGAAPARAAAPAKAGAPAAKK
jgi:small basic protein (TIGR04137 family)